MIFPPFDEDFGYVTLEAFLAHKPVVTTTDAGGPNEFVDRRRQRLRRRAGSRGARRRRSTASHADRARAAAWGDAGLRARAHDHLGRRHRAAGADSDADEAHHPDPVPQRGRDAAGDARRSAEIGAGHRRHRDARHRRRLARRHGGRRARARRRPRRPLPPPQGPGGRVHGRASTRASSPAPTSSSTPTPTISTPARDIPRLARAAPERRGRHRHRRPQHPRARSTCRGRKKLLQRLGSWVVRQVSNTQVPDTTSGFRAYTREAALRMTIVSEFSYTLESIIQAGKKRMAIAHVPVATQPAHAAVAAVRQRVLVHQAVGARRSCASTRCTSR